MALRVLSVKPGLPVRKAPLVLPALPVLRVLSVKPARSAHRGPPVACWAMRTSMR